MRTRRPVVLAVVVGFACLVDLVGVAPAVARGDDATPAPGASAGASSEPHRSWLAPPRPIWPLIPILAVAGAGIVVSAVYSLRSGSDQGSYDNYNAEIVRKTGTFGSPDGTGACAKPSSTDIVTACNGLKSSQDAVNTDNTLIVVGGIVTGTAVVAGLIYYFLGPGKDDGSSAASRPVVAPWVGTGGSGLTVIGRF